MTNDSFKSILCYFPHFGAFMNIFVFLISSVFRRCSGNMLIFYYFYNLDLRYSSEHILTFYFIQM